MGYDRENGERQVVDWTWFDQPDDAWKKVNPKIARIIEELERILHTLEMLGDEYHYLMHRRKDKNVK